MLIAVALIVIVLGSVLFHFASPWWTTPLASNWQQMDDTLTITLVVTGLFFVVITLFLAYVVLRYRHRDGHRAAYEPENKKLERWLIVIPRSASRHCWRPAWRSMRNMSKRPAMPWCWSCWASSGTGATAFPVGRQAGPQRPTFRQRVQSLRP